jgi:hypothetical protein
VITAREYLERQRDAKPKRRTHRFPEYEEQKMLFNWAEKHVVQVPEIANLFAIPNAGGYSGGYKANVIRAKRLKAMGVKAGVLDTFLAVARHGFHGLFMEFKAPGEIAETSPDQEAWIQAFQSHGYLVRVVDNWRVAWNHLCDYLDLPAMYRQTILPQRQQMRKTR